jgi:hypothetical protein
MSGDLKAVVGFLAVLGFITLINTATDIMRGVPRGTTMMETFAREDN